MAVRTVKYDEGVVLFIITLLGVSFTISPSFTVGLNVEISNILTPDK